MTSIHPRYIVKNPSEEPEIASCIPVIRASDSAMFLASKFPNVVAKDPKKDTATVKLATAILPTAAVPISRILNHPNIISLVDIVHTSALPGSVSMAGDHGDITIWEDMNAGSLSYILPSAFSLPSFNDEASWHVLASQNYQRFSLPEGLCWHVLKSISRALLWLHHGVKETEGISGEWMKHDDDWQPILIMDVSPPQIWFKRPKAEEHYGECKLGGFGKARVTGSVGGLVATAQRWEEAPRERKFYWAPEVYKNTHSYSRASEIWGLGAIIYAMMTGIPPSRYCEYSWQISRMNDKGFGDGIREIVGNMLKPHPMDRPTAKQLVDRVDDEWRRWRSTTREGREYIDVLDKRIERSMVKNGD